MQTEEKDYFKLLAYNLFMYAADSGFKSIYTKKYNLSDEQYTNQCKMFLTRIGQESPSLDINNVVRDDNTFNSVFHSCIIGFLSKIDINNDYIMNYEMEKYAKNIIKVAKTITKELKILQK